MVMESLPIPISQSEIVDWDTEWLTCAQDPLYFIANYGHINDADIGKIRVTLYPHLVRLAQLIAENKLIILLKSRQIGFTWFIAHYALWTALFHQGAKILILSKSEEAANETVTYCKFIWLNLPDELRQPIIRDQSSLIMFGAPLNSQIRTCASTETAGIGFGDAVLVIPDEFDFHPYGKENYAEIKPMIDAGGNRKLIIGSAPNVLKPDSKFKELYRGAKTGANNFAYMFLPYNVLPYRDEVWYEEKRKEYDPLELVTRYPRNEEEALTTAKDLCRFDVPSLQELIADARTWHPIEERQNGIIKIYKKPVAGRKYYFPVDPSEGGADPSLGIVFDWQTQEEVAEFSGKISVDEQARIAWELYQEYNEAYCAPERNADGRRLIEKLQGFGVKNFYYELEDKKQEKPGWWTSGRNRPVMIGELADAVSRKDFRLHNAAGLEQFYYFIRTGRKPEGEASKGANDEYVMVTAIGLQIRKSMPSGTGITISTMKYRD